MKFGPVPLAEALGAVLAHSAEARGAQGPYRIAKGTFLTAQHLEGLAAAGMEHVVVAQLEAGDLHEDQAAWRLAESLVDGRSGLVLGPAARGRVNLHAARAGVVALDALRITDANRCDPGITIATVAPWQRLAEGGLAATIKIIPYGVESGVLEAACAAARGSMGLEGARFGLVTLIETAVGGKKLPDKGRRVTAERLARLNAALSPRVQIPHQAQAIAEALRAAPGEVLLILTGSATSDAHDVAPAGLRAAGGRVAHYGMPVDPGNLLFLGALGEKPVIGLPGCARSPSLNGADWVLERVLCGVEIGPQEITAMGVGGLLKESPARPQPRDL